MENTTRFINFTLFSQGNMITTYSLNHLGIVALTMVMCLSLLVYSICERKLRMVLKEQKKSIMNQVGKPTQIPTLRWIFQLFEDVHLIKIEENEEVRYEVKNLRPDGITVLNILGEEYMAQYLLA